MRRWLCAVLCAMATAVPLWSASTVAKDAEKEICDKPVLHLGEGVERIEWLFPGASVLKFMGFVLYQDGRALKMEGSSEGLCDPDPNHKVYSSSWLTPEERDVTSRLLEFRPEMNGDDSSGTAEPGPLDDTPAVAFLVDRSTVYDHVASGRGYQLTSFAMLMNKAQRYRIIDLRPDRVFLSRHLNPFAIGGDDNRALGLGAALIEGHVTYGPALSVYGYYGGRLGLIARTPWHGDRRGWMALVKARDLDGDGCPELVVVRDPQANGTLEIWELRHETSPDGTPFTLVKRAEAEGFSNHAYGTASTRISLAVDADGDGTVDLIVPDRTRKFLRVMSLKDDGLEEVHRIALPAPAAHDLSFHAMYGKKRTLTLVVPLEDNTVRLVPLDMARVPYSRPSKTCTGAYKPE